MELKVFRKIIVSREEFESLSLSSFIIIFGFIPAPIFLPIMYYIDIISKIKNDLFEFILSIFGIIMLLWFFGLLLILPFTIFFGFISIIRMLVYYKNDLSSQTYDVEFSMLIFGCIQWFFYLLFLFNAPIFRF